jgi:hypothetical protein
MLALNVGCVIVLSFVLLVIPLMLYDRADVWLSSLVMISEHDEPMVCNDVRDRTDAEEPGLRLSTRLPCCANVIYRGGSMLLQAYYGAV